MNLYFPAGPAQQWATLNVLIGGALLSGALFFEFIMGLPPCPLCMMQRIWFILAAGVTYISLLHNPRWGIYPVISGLCAVVGGGFALRHLWLQSLPADQVPACGPDLAYMIEVFPFSDILTAMVSGTGDCAEEMWSFLWITLPGWALIGFVAMLICSLIQLRKSIA